MIIAITAITDVQGRAQNLTLTPGKANPTSGPAAAPTPSLHLQWVGRMAASGDTAHLSMRLSLAPAVHQYNQVVAGILAATNSTSICKGDAYCPEAAERANLVRELKPIRTRLIALNGMTRSNYKIMSLVDEGDDYDSANKRFKKSIIGDILGVVAVGLATYDLIEITALKAQFYGQQQEINVIGHQVNDTRHAINANIEAIHKIIEALNQTTTALSQLRRQQSMLVVAEHLRGYTINTVAWLDNVEDLLVKQTFSHRLLDEAAFMEALAKLNFRGRQKHLRLAAQDPTAISQLKPSFLVEDNYIYIFIHVPMLREPDYDLYKRLEGPIPLPNGKMATLSNQVPRYLGVATDGMGTVSLHNDEFEQCKKLSGRFVCPPSPVLSRGTDDCLSSIYRGSSSATTCQVDQWTSKIESIVPAGNGHVLIYAPEGNLTTGRVVCNSKGGRSGIHELRIEGFRDVEVPSGCFLKTDNYYYIPSEDTGLHADITLHPVPSAHLKQLMEQLRQLNDTARIKDIIYNQTTLPDVEIFGRWVHAASSLSLGMMALLASLGVIIGLCCVCHVEKRRRNRKVHNGQQVNDRHMDHFHQLQFVPPRYHGRQRDVEFEEHIRTLFHRAARRHSHGEADLHGGYGLAPGPAPPRNAAWRPNYPKASAPPMGKAAALRRGPRTQFDQKKIQGLKKTVVFRKHSE